MGALLAVCGAGCEHRSVAALAGELPIPQETTLVRIEVDDGSIKVVAPAAQPAPAENPAAGGDRVIRYHGGVRRGAGSAVELAELERLSAELVARQDPDRPGVLVVTGPRRPADSAPGTILGVEAVVELPRELAVEVVVAGSGHLTVEDRQADADLRTGRGDLKAARCAGALAMQTGTGMTIVYDHRGPIDVRALVGDMQVFVREPGERIRLVTGQGNVQCLVPPETGFRLDARTETGKVANGFGIANERQGYTSTMLGTRGDARVEILLRSSSGHLSLSHKTWE